MPLKLTYRLKSESIVRWFLDREIENKSRERERRARAESIRYPVSTTLWFWRFGPAKGATRTRIENKFHQQGENHCSD